MYSLSSFLSSPVTEIPDVSPDGINVDIKTPEELEPKPELLPQQNLEGLNQSIDDEDDTIAPTYIDIRNQHMIVSAGLRGPIAYAATELFPTECKYYRTAFY